jgi:tRNA (adenine37-N6)-methyltransferase
MNITVQPVAFVTNTRNEPIDDQWSEVVSGITLADHVPSEALLGLDQFSHLEIIYYFDRVNVSEVVFAGHPRGNRSYPRTGIFGQRKKDRPNQLGLTTVELVAVEDRRLTVRYLDAIDGTPVLDIKPVFRQFQVKREIVQPAWVEDLMKNYW